MECLFCKDFQASSAFTVAVLVKIVEPLEGTNAAQMGILGTQLQRSTPVPAERVKVRLFQGLWGRGGKEALTARILTDLMAQYLQPWPPWRLRQEDCQV